MLPAVAIASVEKSIAARSSRNSQCYFRSRFFFGIPSPHELLRSIQLRVARPPLLKNARITHDAVETHTRQQFRWQQQTDKEDTASAGIAVKEK